MQKEQLKKWYTYLQDMKMDVNRWKGSQRMFNRKCYDSALPPNQKEETQDKNFCDAHDHVCSKFWRLSFTNTGM